MLKRKFKSKLGRGISVFSILSIILPAQLFAAFPALAVNSEHNDRIFVCHITHNPRTPFETIEVANQSLLAGHMEHGDTAGECQEHFSDISGCKFFDKDADGIRDDDEVTLPGWTIRLEDAGIVQYEKVTDINGCYEFRNIEPGNYEISEVQMSGFRQTYPEGGKHAVSAVINNNFINLDFGNTRDGRSYSCENPVILDFDSDSSRNPILKGQLIDSEYSAQGVAISAKNFNPSHPQKAIIFDSNNPSGNINGDHLKDIDLGTPNKMFGGPGDSQTGDGFEPSNYLRLNNLLTIPDNDVDTSPADGYVDDPNDEPAGGEFTFIFSRLFSFDSVQYIDLDHNSGEVRGFSDASSTAQVFSIPVEKDNGNSVQTVVGDATTQIKSLKLKANDSHAIDSVVLCPVISCGDAFIEGSEQCDAGVQNGIECTPGYGETCQYCSGQCELKEKQGQFCGDEIKNGEEACDGQDGIGLHQVCTDECRVTELPYCGDGTVNGDDECDDGNILDGDGCSAQCLSEICPGNIVLNFEKDSLNGGISKGQFIDEEYAPWGIHVKAHNYNESHPQKAIIFDSSSPSGNINGDRIKDIDLGTPNKMFAGPGDSETGNGFESSNNKALHNLLIIPDNVVDTNPSDGFVDDPNDEPAGGSLRFIFDRLYAFESVQYIDFDHGTASVVGYSDVSGNTQVVSIPLTKGNGNSVQKVSGNKTTPIRFLKLRGEDSYGVDNVSLCPIITCGDGIEEGREQCDSGSQNGIECSPAYGLSCQFCTSECVLQEKVGPRCGDNIKNGDEACDGQDGTPQGSICSDACTIETSCDENEEFIVNGGFESPIVTNSAGWDIYTSLQSGWNTQWTSLTPSSFNSVIRPQNALLEIQKGIWTPAEGVQYAELDTDWDGPNGSLNGEPASVMIYQDIPTTPGKQYNVIFSFSPRPDTGSTNNILELRWGGNVADTISGAGSGNTSWVPKSYSFVATSTLTRLQFADGGTQDSLGTFLDKVSVKCENQVTPRCGDGVVNGDEECDGTVNCSDECEVISDEPVHGEICAVKYFDHDGNGRKDSGDENLSDWEITVSQKLECSENDQWADSVVSFRQGLRGNGSAVDAERSDATKALGNAQNDDSVNFVSLGFGGEIVLKFNNIIENLAGDDIAVTETSFGSPDCETYPEKARVYASQSGMADSWVDLGVICLDKTLDLGSLAWARYLKFIDVSDPDKFNEEADGYDLDGVSTLHCKKLTHIETLKTSTSGVCFDNLAFGEYHVEETMKGGWINTSPIGIQLEISEAIPEKAVYFGNRTIQDVLEGAICGFKFEDMNGDGLWQVDDGEKGLGGWAIRAENASGIRETITSSDPANAGEYCFYSLSSGTWKISEIMQDGWKSTTGENKDITISSFEGSVNNNFGNFKLGEVAGYKYNDIDGDGLLDDGEHGIEGWEIMLTNLGNNTTTATTTSSDGSYYFSSLMAGNYEVREATSTDWTRTYPTSTPEYTINIVSGSKIAGKNFLNSELPINASKEYSVNVCKYNDVVGDGHSVESTDDILYTAEGGWEMKIFGLSSIALKTGVTSNGCYEFRLQEGVYKVSESRKTDWSIKDAWINGVQKSFSSDLAFDDFVEIQVASTTPTTTVNFYNHFSEGSTDGDPDPDPTPEPTPTPPENNGGGGSGGGGGGGGGTLFGLEFHTEKVSGVGNASTVSVLVTWFTNLPSTSRVVYDTISHSDIGFPPSYGYAFFTPMIDQDPKVLFHSVLIEGLQFNVTYFFRPLSSASPEKYGKEVSFTASALNENSEIPNENPDNGQGGDSVENPSSNSAPQPSPSPIPVRKTGGSGNSSSGENFGIGGELPLDEETGEILGAELDDIVAEKEGPSATTTPIASQDDGMKNQWKTFFWLILFIILLWLFFLWYNKKDDSDDNPKGDGSTHNSTSSDPKNILDRIE